MAGMLIPTADVTEEVYQFIEENCKSYGLEFIPTKPMDNSEGILGVVLASSDEYGEGYDLTIIQDKKVIDVIPNLTRFCDELGWNVKGFTVAAFSFVQWG